MQNLAALFRAAQLYTQFAHHTIKGPSFFADHAFLGDLYDKYADFYDSTVERMIGLGMAPNIAEITTKACTYASQGMQDNDAATFFKRIIGTNRDIYAAIRAVMEDANDGMQNLVQGFADSLASVDYKIGQRLG